MQITIWLQDDLVEAIKADPRKLNVSKICQEAVRSTLADKPVEITITTLSSKITKVVI